RVSVSEAVIGAGGGGRLGRAVLPFPVAELVREVEQADLLELRRRVQRRALGDVELARYRVEDRVALLLGATVRHREAGAGPVRVGRTLVAVRDAAEGRH